MRRLLPLLLSVLVGVAGLLGPVRAARAEGANCMVRVIQALPTGGEFDERLQVLHAQLTRPPFSAFKTFRLLGQHELAITPGSPASFSVPGDHQGSLTFKEHVQGAKKKRVRLGLEIKDGSARLMSTVFLIDNGGTVLQGGIKHDGGVLVLGVTCHLHE